MSEKRKQKREVQKLIRKLDVEFKLLALTLWDLYTMWTGKHPKWTLVSSSENLQRLIQKHKWDIPRNQSTWEMLLCGGHTLHNYIVVKVDSLIEHCNNEIENCKESEPERAQGFEEVKEEFQKIKDEAEAQGKVAYLNLDGQSRIDQPIKNFFENKFPVNMKKVREWVDEENEELTYFRMDVGKDYYFKNLPELVKQDIKDIEVSCAISDYGTFEIYKEMVIGVNSTDSWTPFQKSYLGPSLLKSRMLTVLNDPAITAMFINNSKLFTGTTYSTSLYGDRRFLQELILFTAPGCKKWPDEDTLFSYSGEFNKERIPPKSHFANVKKWLADFAKILEYGFSNNKSMSNLNLAAGLNLFKSYCLLMKCITYRNDISRENQFDKYKILDIKLWVTDFIEDEAARMSNFEDAYLKNPNFQSSKCTQKKMKTLKGNFSGRKYRIDDYGVHEYVKNGDSYSETYRNNDTKYMATRIRYLKAKLDDRLQDYLDRNIIVLKVDSGLVSKNQKRDALVEADFMEGITGKKLTPRQAFSSDTETHHMKKVEYGGETELSNLTPTLKEHNRALG